MAEQPKDPFEKMSLFEVAKASASNAVQSMALQAKVDQLAKKIDEPKQSNYLVWGVFGLVALLIWKGKII